MNTLAEFRAVYRLPLPELMLRAAEVHREHRDVQRCALLSIKTGGCPEDCGYCSQSAHYDSPVQREPLMSVEEVRERAEAAHAAAIEKAKDVAGKRRKVAALRAKRAAMMGKLEAYNAADEILPALCGQLKAIEMGGSRREVRSHTHTTGVSMWPTVRIGTNRNVDRNSWKGSILQ